LGRVCKSLAKFVNVQFIWQPWRLRLTATWFRLAGEPVNVSEHVTRDRAHGHGHGLDCEYGCS